MINLSRNKNICCGLKKVVAKRARVYFEQQILALLLFCHQTHNLSRNKFARALASQQIRAPHFFNPQQMFLLRNKLITQSEKRETSTKTCNETMLRVKLGFFLISYFAAFTLSKNRHILKKVKAMRDIKPYNNTIQCNNLFNHVNV